MDRSSPPACPLAPARRPRHRLRPAAQRPSAQARPPTNLRARPLSVDMLRPGRSSRGKGRGIRTLVRWFIVIVAAVISHGEPGADFAGFGGADGGVPGEGLLPVVPGLN